MEVATNFVLSNCTPHRTYTELLPPRDAEKLLGGAFLDRIEGTDYSCGAFKINCAVDDLPNFLCAPHDGHEPQAHHRGTIHFENAMAEIEQAAAEVGREKRGTGGDEQERERWQERVCV